MIKLKNTKLTFITLLAILLTLVFMLILVNITSIFTHVGNGIAFIELAISVILSLICINKIYERLGL